MKITEDEFIERFQPEKARDGSYYRHRDWNSKADMKALRSALRSNRLWTAVEGDSGNWCVSSGYYYVNRLYYIITRIPITAGEEFWIEGRRS